jgi:hypothetical protein
VSAYRDPVELVRKAVQNEIKASNDDSAHFLFRGTKTTPKGPPQRSMSRPRTPPPAWSSPTTANPLTPEQRRDEEARVERFVTDPEELRRKREQERGAPSARCASCAPCPMPFCLNTREKNTAREGIGRAGDPLVKLNFRPNPGLPAAVARGRSLAGMQGYVLVDAVHYRIASIDGTLFKEVGFGWGILGHLDRGGRFHGSAAGGRRQSLGSFKHDVEFTGKILLFKSLNINSTEVFSGFKRVPGRPDVRPGAGTAEERGNRRQIPLPANSPTSKALRGRKPSRASASVSREKSVRPGRSERAR